MVLPHDLYKDFPRLLVQEHGHPYVYLDNAATTQKPQEVIDALVSFYAHDYGTVHRGVYSQAERATTLYEQARATVASFIGADADEIIFTKNCTEAINTVAFAWAASTLQAGDEIVLTQYEHHANLLPWQRLADTHGVLIRFIPVRADGTLDLTNVDTIITSKTKLVAVSAASNVTGAYTDLVRIKQAADVVQAHMLVDAAQMVAHEALDVHALGVEFLAFSGHKIYGPTGVGVLYCKRTMMSKMQPFLVGGGTVFQVSYTHATYLEGPQRFEAGTPTIADAIGLAAALQYLSRYSFQDIQQHEAALTCYLIEKLKAFPAITLIGPHKELCKKGHLVSFIVQGYHAHDVAAYLSERGIAVRAGHHCAQPLADLWHGAATLRASFAIYNRFEDVDALVAALTDLLGA